MAGQFDGLVPASGLDQAAWFLDAMRGREGVALVVPPGFDAYVRILHRLQDGVAWADVAPQLLGPGTVRYEYPFPDRVIDVEGDMGASLVEAILPPMASATRTPERCHYGLWEGWGDLQPGSHTTWYAVAGSMRAVDRMRLDVRRRWNQMRAHRRDRSLRSFVEGCAVAPWWGGRGTLLFDGPLDGVLSIGRSPQWWWPEDHAWFVGNEIDHPWSYVAGSRPLIESILAAADIEAVEVDHDAIW